jgi:hypothetical protein
MKHVVDTGAVEEPMTVGDGADAFDDLERTGKLQAELAPVPRCQGLSRAMKDSQLDPITHGELQITMVAVVVLFSVLLGLQQAVADVRQERIVVLQQGVHSVGARGPCSVRQ